MNSISKKRLLEKGPGFSSGLRDLKKNLNSKTITAGFVAAVFGCTGPAILIINTSAGAGYTTEQTISWLLFQWINKSYYVIIL